MPAPLLTPLACHRPQTRFLLLPGLTRAPSGDVFSCSASGEGRWAGSTDSPQQAPPALGVTAGSGRAARVSQQGPGTGRRGSPPTLVWDEEVGALAPDPGSTDGFGFLNSETLWLPGQHSRESTQRRLETVAWTAVGPHARWESLRATTAASTGPIVPSRMSRAPPGG